jgi:flagellar biogenesis protein FliO
MGDTSVLELALRLVFSLGVVLAIMAGAATVLKRSKGFNAAVRRRPVELAVVARQSLGKHASLAVVHTGGRELVIGITNASISLLSDREAPASQDQDHQDQDEAIIALDLTATPRKAIVSGSAAQPAWKTAVETMRDRTVRRS